MSRLLFARTLPRQLASPKTSQIRLQSTLVKEVTSMDSFKNLISQPKLSIIDFYAVWCGPCKLMSPVLEKFLKEYENDTQFLKIDVDQQQDIAQEYGVSAMPTFMLFKSGEGIGKIVGANPNGLKQAIEQYK